MTAVIGLAQLPTNTNQILKQLTNTDRQQLLKHAELVELPFAELLCKPGDCYQYLYFPLTCLISLIAKLPGHPPLEMGLIGFEGLLGATLILQQRQVPQEGIVQGAGIAWRIAVAPAELEILRIKTLQLAMQRYLFQLIQQQAQNAVCAHFHQVEARLARWLLMSDDRMQHQALYFTHQFLAQMLGVRRSSITVAAGDLMVQGFIHYHRGHLKILNRQGLLQHSCRCYQPLATATLQPDGRC